jgi:hypothetical protein
VIWLVLASGLVNVLMGFALWEAAASVKYLEAALEFHKQRADNMMEENIRERRIWARR